MKVKIYNIIYDANEHPIMIILDDDDKKNIRDMDERDHSYCRVPEGTEIEVVKQFMGI